ncbi:hypothetical protein [Sneathiella chinensis]|uniref:hypothetical protein n=1 Tax=Sneathiella chinensis TaxID=349750 RepID=UPI00146BEDAC|nr:hypothetical protein [Sneathiella chinensis]
MTEDFFIPLANGWALKADELQWMICRLRKRHAQWVWHPVSYIGSTKTNLLLCMRRKAFTPTSEAKVQLDEMPERFKDWLSEFHQQNTRQKVEQPSAATEGCPDQFTFPSTKEFANDCIIVSMRCLTLKANSIRHPINYRFSLGGLK